MNETIENLDYRSVVVLSIIDVEVSDGVEVTDIGKVIAENVHVRVVIKVVAGTVGQMETEHYFSKLHGKEARCEDVNVQVTVEQTATKLDKLTIVVSRIGAAISIKNQENSEQIVVKNDIVVVVTKVIKLIGAVSSNGKLDLQVSLN